MKTMKIVTLLCIASALFAGVAWGGQQKVIGFSNRTTSGHYFAALTKAVQDAGEAAGYRVIVADAETNFTKQIADVEDLLNQDLDYLILNPQDPKAGMQIVKKANEAGVPVVIVDCELEGNADVITSISSNNFGGNELLGAYAASMMGNQPIKLALVSFMQGNIVCQQRRTGFIAGLIERQLSTLGYSNVEIVMQTWALATDEGGLRCTEDILTAHPEVNMIYSETSLQIVGVVNAVRASNRQDIKVFSYDGAKFEFDMVKNGQLEGTAENSPRKLAGIALDVINRYERGERSFPSNMSPKAVMVNKDNVDEVYEDGF